MKKLLLVVIGLGVLAGVGAVAWPTLRGLGAHAADVPTYEVARGDFVRRVYAEGNLQAVDATLLGPPPEVPTALKIAWLAQDGTPVTEGDVVIRFDPSEMEEDLREGRHEKATSNSQITQKQALEQGSRRNLELDAEMATLELDYAQEFQSKDAEIFSRTEIIESEIDEELARERQDHAEDAGEIHSDLVNAELDLLTIERRKAEIKIDQAEAGLQALEVRAPHDGIFVLKQIWGRTPEVGQVVWGGNPVAEIPKPENMEAQVYVLEADAGGLEVGLPAKVTIDAHPGIVYEASVKKVDALAQRRNRRVPVQYFGVTLELETTEQEVMKPGQRVEAVLTLEQQEDVITVPRQAIFEEQGEKIVYRREGSRFKPARVTLGTTALGRVVVAEGIEVGDLIALRDPTRPAEAPAGEATNGGAGPLGSGS